MNKEEIKGRSFRVCQKHYDKRSMTGLVYTDEIVSVDKCAFCNQLNKNLDYNGKWECQDCGEIIKNKKNPD